MKIGQTFGDHWNVTLVSRMICSGSQDRKPNQDSSSFLLILLTLFQEVNAAWVSGLSPGWTHARPQAPSPNPTALLRDLGWKSSPGTYQVIAEITEVIASYKHGYYLPVFLKIYLLK